MGAGSEAGEPDGTSALNQAQASLLDLTDGGEAAPSAGPTPTAAAATGFSGLDDLMSLGGGAGGGGMGAAAAPAAAPGDLLAGLMGGGASPAPPAAAPAAPAGGLAGLEDLLGGLGGGNGMAQPAAPPAAPAAPSVSLVPQPQLSPQQFQQQWAAWTPLARSFQQQLSSGAVGGVEANGFRVSKRCGGGWGQGDDLGAFWRAACPLALTSPLRPTAPAAPRAPAGLHCAHRAGACGHVCDPARGRRAALPFPAARAGGRQRRARAGAGAWGAREGSAGCAVRLVRPCNAACTSLAPKPHTLAPPRMQVTVSKSPPAAAVVVKSDDAAAAAYVEELLQTLLLTL